MTSNIVQNQKFKVGDKVVVVDTHLPHSMPNGTVTLLKMDSFRSVCTTEGWYFSDDQLEHYVDPKQEWVLADTDYQQKSNHDVTTYNGVVVAYREKVSVSEYKEHRVNFCGARGLTYCLNPTNTNATLTGTTINGKSVGTWTIVVDKE